MNAAEPRRGVRLVRRIYLPRVVGLGLGAVAVAGGLHQAGAPVWAWALLAINGFVWPHAAYFWAMRSASPYYAEHRNLLIDSACGGFWVVAMGFNLLPSVLIVAMLSMDNVAVGGVRLFLRGVIAHAIGALLAWPLLGGAPLFAPSLSTVIACIPFMLTFPVMIGVITYRLSQKLSQQKRDLEAVSRRDPLSGLASRGHWEERLHQEFHRWQRHGRPAALLLLDIDHFKRINDTYGHPFGDAVIRSVGELLRKQVRTEDIVGRYGGEEFAAILPDSRAPDAQVAAERIRRGMASIVLPGESGQHLTVSIGIAMLSWRVADARAWVNHADQALYRAKREGRNCVRIVDLEAEAQTGAATRAQAG